MHTLATDRRSPSEAQAERRPLVIDGGAAAGHALLDGWPNPAATRQVHKPPAARGNPRTRTGEDLSRCTNHRLPGATPRTRTGEDLSR